VAPAEQQSLVTEPQRQPLSAARRFRSGLFWGILCGLLAGAALLLAATQLGLLNLSVPALPGLVVVWTWTYDNLRLSVIPFGVILAWYTATLLALHRALRDPATAPETVLKYDRYSDLQSLLFFGVGVIWTAIGLRSALLTALDGLDAETAARLGAFSILQRLVEGGILLALTTTIVGGVGGYLMRVIKAFGVGWELDRFHELRQNAEAERVLARLDAIEQAVRQSSPASLPLESRHHAS